MPDRRKFIKNLSIGSASTGEKKGRPAIIILSHHDVDGNVLFQHQQYASGQWGDQ